MCLAVPDLEQRTLAKGEHAGFEWHIVNNDRFGFRCGYVRVLPGHPWFGARYDEVNAEVHGGLTFAEHGTACPTHGKADEWWLGFDCGHGGDASDPSLPAEHRDVYDYGVVRTQAYVEAECRSLCEQARDAAQ